MDIKEQINTNTCITIIFDAFLAKIRQQLGWPYQQATQSKQAESGPEFIKCSSLVPKD